MKKSSFDPVDIAGVILGTLSVLLVVLCVVFLVVLRPLGFAHWRGPWFSGLRELEQLGDLGKKGPWQKVEEDRSVPGAFKDVEVRGVAGSITVTGGPASSVQVHSVKSGLSPRAMEGLSVDIQNEGDRLVISEKREGPGMMRLGAIDFTVSLPPGVKMLTARTVSGSVVVRDVEPGISQHLESVSGSVSTTQTGDLRASSTSGRVEFTFDGRDLDVHSISGSVGGTIQSIQAGGSVRLSTVSGSVDVAAFPALSARVTLRSISGSVSCDFPVSQAQQKGHSLEGTIGGGAVPVDMTTTSGSVRLHRR